MATLERLTSPARKSASASTLLGCGGVSGPRTLRAVEQNGGECVAVIELFELRTAEFAAEAELMFAGGVGHDVGQVAGDVFAAFRRRQADLVEAGDLDVRGAGDD